MITDERAEPGRVRLSHRLRDFLGIVPEDEPDSAAVVDAPAPVPAVERAVVVAVATPPPEPVTELEAHAETETEPPVAAKRKRRAVAGPHTDAERARVREIVDELRAGLDEMPSQG